MDGARVQNANMFHHIGNLLINPDILKKVDIEVGANSVVTNDIPPYSIATGSPAKVVRQLTESEKVEVNKKY